MFPPRVSMLAPPLVYDVCSPAACVTTLLQACQPAWATVPVCGRSNSQSDRAPLRAAVMLQ